MSRIDQALQKWEGGLPDLPATPSPTPAANGTTEPFGFNGYVPEGAIAADLPAAVQPTVVPPAPARPATTDVRSTVAQLAHGRPEAEARLVIGRSGSVPLEQYRRLAAILHDVQLERGLKTLMITSALPHEGKTLTIVNLALTLSESFARRVLIIDADLRFPAVHTLLGLPNDVGLSEALASQQGDIPIRHLSPRLSLLSAGRPGPMPLAGLTSARMSALLEDCSSQFDWVLLDTPPVGLLPDAQVLARLTRAVVLVIAAGSTPSATVERAVAELGPECIVGTVLNRVEERRIPDAAYYTHYGASTPPA